MAKKIEDYLHLYLGCEVQINAGQKKRAFFTGVDRFGYAIVTFENSFGKQTHGHYRLESLIPALRPLSDMTEEEMDVYCKLDRGCNVEECEVQEHKIKHSQIWYLDGTWDNTEFSHEMVDKYASLEYPNPEQFRFLMSKGFDLFGLIEEGLAIDKTTLKP